MNTALITLTLLLRPALAEELPQLGVTGLHLEGVSEREAERLQADLVQLLSQSPVVLAVDEESVATQLRGREALVLEDMATGQGRRSLSDGQALYDRALFEDAEEVLGRAVTQLELGASLSGDVKPLMEAWMLLGMSRLVLGLEDAAEEAWRELLVLEPEHQLDTLRYPPNIIEAFEGARARLASDPGAVISIEALGSGAVFLDGRSLSLPLEAEPLPAGRHILELQDEEGDARIQVVYLKPNQHLKVRELPPARTRLAEVQEEERKQIEQIHALYSALGRFTELDYWLVGGGSPDEGLTLSLYSPRAEGYARSWTVPWEERLVLESYDPGLSAPGEASYAYRAPALSIAANPILESMLLDPPELSTGAPPPPLTEVSTEPTRRVSPWLWAGLGVVGAGGVTAAVLATSGEPAGESETVVEEQGQITLGPLP